MGKSAAVLAAAIELKPRLTMRMEDLKIIRRSKLAAMGAKAVEHADMKLRQCSGGARKKNPFVN